MMNQQPLYSLRVFRYDTRAAMGEAAAADVVQAIRNVLRQKDEARMIFAAAPSQNEFLAALTASKEIDFSRVVAFHMDEYVGLPSDAPQGFGNFLRARLFERAPFKAVHYLNGNAETETECARYAALLAEAPIDIVCMGIGENGHIAFNDPAVADLDDPLAVKCVELDEVCRMQQVHDGCFAKIADVPTHALTLTVPRLMNAAQHFCMVPSRLKAEAVRRTVYGEISAVCPATAMRRAPDARLYLDADSASLL